jgi:molybdopterin synthase catalytic subunit
MKVHVRYFAVLRERLGRDEDQLDLPPGADVAAALDLLAKKHDVVGPLLPFLQVAVNQSVSPWDRGLADGDELALIPPVAGGGEAARLARVVNDRAPSLENVLEAVRGPGMGGVATFTGLVRDHSDGRVVERLEYEAYEPMAEKVFRELCEEIEHEIEGTRLAVEHRTGALVVGDVAVVIAAAAPHRAEAFRACQAMIDRLKQRAPIWKKEIGPDGSSWVGVGP